MGGHHAHTLLKGNIPGCELAAVCDQVPQRLKPFAGVPSFTDHREMIRCGRIDAILIATPHYAHTTIGIDAFKAGLHVLMEKPISVHKADCERLLAAYKGGKQLFAAMFNQRTDPYYQKIRQMVRGGELGRIQRIQWTVTDWFRSQAYYNSGGWRATWAGEGGGVLLNQSVHNIDLFQWIFGMPERVRAICRIARYHNIEVEDEVTATFEYPDKTTGVFITSTGEAPGVNRLEVAGDRGRLTLENNQLLFLRNEIKTSTYSRITTEAYEKPACWKIRIPIADHGEQHTGILKNFTNAILRGEPLLSPGVEGVHSVELINAMLYSSFRDETVTLPLSSAKYAKLLKSLIRQSTFRKKVARYHGGQGNYLLEC